MALEFYPPRLHTMESLLQTLVTNVLNVTHWTRGEAQAQDTEAVFNACSLLHTAGLDGVGGTTELVSHHIFLCPCTGQRVSEQRSTLKKEYHQSIWHIKCSHDACEKPGSTITRSLGQSQTGTKGRLWMPSDWRPLHMTAAQFVTSADTVTQTLLETGWVSPTQMQRLCIVATAKLGWDYNLIQHADTERTAWLQTA